MQERKARMTIPIMERNWRNANDATGGADSYAIDLEPASIIHPYILVLGTLSDMDCNGLKGKIPTSP